MPFPSYKVDSKCIFPVGSERRPGLRSSLSAPVWLITLQFSDMWFPLSTLKLEGSKAERSTTKNLGGIGEVCTWLGTTPLERKWDEITGLWDGLEMKGQLWCKEPHMKEFNSKEQSREFVKNVPQCWRDFCRCQAPVLRARSRKALDWTPHQVTHWLFWSLWKSPAGQTKITVTNWVPL